MQLPLIFSELSIFLAVSAIFLLIASELTSSNCGITRLIINNKKLKNVALATGIGFLIIVTITITNLIT